MSKTTYTYEQRKALKSQRNRDNYHKAKTTQDKVILRLDKGQLAKLDAASSASGLSRAAFARLFLFPILDAMSSRLGAIDVARIARKQSLAQFLGHAISPQRDRFPLPARNYRRSAPPDCETPRAP